MAQMGHTTPNLTLAIYARQMDRRDGEPECLKALVEGGLLAELRLTTAQPPPIHPQPEGSLQMGTRQSASTIPTAPSWIIGSH